MSVILSNDIIHAQELLNALEQNPWKTYIEVLAENGKVAIDEINNHLDPNLGIQKSVEITGIGGLGKTSVAREYMKRCIHGRYRQDNPYSYYFYYTAKGEMGEVETRYGKENFIQSSGWMQGGGLYVPQLNFNQFLSKICTSLNLPVDLEELTKYLRGHPVLIVLDNFEDVNAENKKKYTDFLQRIRVAATKSRVIITSRKKREFQDEAQEIRLRELEGAKGTDLIYERYKFLAREHYLSDERREKRNNIDRQEEALHRHYLRVTQFLERYVNRKAELTDGNPDDVVADLLDRLDQNQREDVMLNLRHPIMLMRIASLLNSHLVDDVLESGNQTEREDDALVTDNRSVLDILLAILSLPKYGFLEYKRNVIKYIINKAWDSILHEEFCKEILEILYRQPDMKISYGQLRQSLAETTEHEGPIYDPMERAVNKIRKHSVFLVEEDDDDDEEYVQLLDNARSILSTIFTASPTDASSAQEAKPKVVDLIEKLGPKQTVDNWDEFEPMVQEFCLAVTQHELKEALGSEKLREIEDALFAKLTEAKISKPIEQNMAAAIQFFAHATDRSRGVEFTIEKLETLIQSFSTLPQDSLDFLCANWFNGGNRLQDKAPITQMRLVVMLLSRGIQQNVSVVRQLFFKLLADLGRDDLSTAFSSVNERNDLRNLLSRYANYIEWNMRAQRLFLDFDVELEDTDRFKTGVVGDYRSMGLEILHHPESETTDNADANTCYVCQSQANMIMLFILKPKTVSTKQENKTPTPEFNKWLSKAQNNHPGFSSDAKTFAADILAVHEFYNEYFLEANNNLAQRGPFSVAIKLKKNFFAYHTSENSATAVAFIIGYRANMEAMDFGQMHTYMVDEVYRRLSEYPQPNIYFTKDEIYTWNNLFVAHCEKAMKLIREQPDLVRSIMESRMRSDHQMPVRRVTSNPRQEREKYIPSEHERQIPTNLADYVIEMAGRPMLNDRRLRQEMKARVGVIAYQSGVDYENKKGNKREYLNLPHTWVDTICGVIFSRPVKADFSRYSKEETAELLKEILTTHFR